MKHLNIRLELHRGRFTRDFNTLRKTVATCLRYALLATLQKMMDSCVQPLTQSAREILSRKANRKRGNCFTVLGH